MASHWSLGKAASRYVGTSRSLAHWPSHTSTEHLIRQVQQQSWRPLAEDKYVDLGARYIFEPIAIETLGVFNASSRQLLDDLGRKISINTVEVRETSFLFKRISVLLQRFSAVMLHDNLPAADCTD